jgi:preprotein translocase subunit SecY
MRWLKDFAGRCFSRAAYIRSAVRWRRLFSFAFFIQLWFSIRKETADNLKKSGAFVPGIRPGEQTARYIDKILMRLTLVGAAYITIVCLLAGVSDIEVECARFISAALPC